MTNSTWNFLPEKLPQCNVPVLAAKDLGSKIVVREATYKGKGYWSGFENAPVLAWRLIPLAPVALELKEEIKERDQILNGQHASPLSHSQERRLQQLEAKIEKAVQARENQYEKLIREAAEALTGSK